MTTKGTQSIIDYRKRRKELILEGFGNKCQICGYDRCQKALEFHHLDPSKKEIELSREIKSWEKMKEEVKKCICVCANCHREIHDGLIDVDISKQYFDESKVEGYDPSHPICEKYYDACPVCGKRKLKWKRACSRSCYNKLPYKVDWSKYDVIKMVDEEHKSFCSIARMLNVSDSAVRKRYRKLKGL